MSIFNDLKNFNEAVLYLEEEQLDLFEITVNMLGFKCEKEQYGVPKIIDYDMNKDGIWDFTISFNFFGSGYFCSLEQGNIDCYSWNEVIKLANEYLMEEK